MKKQMLNEKEIHGITLIALVITIIVLLILAGISIAVLTGENGLLPQVQEAKESNINGENVEKIRLGITQANMKIQTGEEEELSEELLESEIKQQYNDEIEIKINKNSDTEYIVNLIDHNKAYLIKDNKVEELKGIIDKSFIVTSSVPININTGITIEKVKEEIQDYNSYEIVGISNDIDGEYNIQNAIGRKGTLTVIGDIKNADFSYKLNDFMTEDDIFYCKVLINDEIEIIQKITMEAAKQITYEEDFEKFKLAEEYAQYYTVVEDERFSNGAALKIEGKGLRTNTVEFETEFEKLELVTMIPNLEENVPGTSATRWTFYEDETKATTINSATRAYGRPYDENTGDWKVKQDIIDWKENIKCYVELSVNASYANEQYPQLSRSNQFYLDAIIITR